jgi:hypothetical protein
LPLQSLFAVIADSHDSVLIWLSDNKKVASPLELLESIREEKRPEKIKTKSAKTLTKEPVKRLEALLMYLKL